MRFLPSGLGRSQGDLGLPVVCGKPTQNRLGTRMDRHDTTTARTPKRKRAENLNSNPDTSNLPDPIEDEILYIGRIYIEPHIARQTMSSTLAEEHDKPRLNPIPIEYQRHRKVFSEEAVQRFSRITHMGSRD